MIASLADRHKINRGQRLRLSVTEDPKTVARAVGPGRITSSVRALRFNTRLLALRVDVAVRIRRIVVEGGVACLIV